MYEIVRRLIDESFIGHDAWDNKDRPLALCAALLHDLGHGPFSHSFEKYLIQTMKHTLKRLLLEILR